MLIADLCEAATTTIAPPRDGARRFGITLGRLYFERHPDGKDDVNNYDYLDDARSRALRYRYIVGPKFRQFLQDVMPEINAAGWHLTAEGKSGSGRRWQLTFEPTQTARVPARGVFWHLAPVSKVASIEQQGLVPKRSRHGLQYPERIYLLRRQEDAARMAEVFGQRDKRPMEYAVFRVDLRRANGITLHTDPELSNVAVYAVQPIPAQYLRRVG